MDQVCKRINAHELYIYRPSFFMKSQVELCAGECFLTGCVYMENEGGTARMSGGVLCLEGENRELACGFKLRYK